MRPPPEGHPPAEGPRGDPLVPHPDRLAPGDPQFAEVMAAHAAAVSAGEPGYADPGTGLFVLTAAYLLARGTCCDQGCRHCPYVGRPAS